MNKHNIIDDYYIEQLIDRAFVHGYFQVKSGQWYARLENRIYTYYGPKGSGRKENMKLIDLKKIFDQLITRYKCFSAGEYFYHFYNGKWIKTNLKDMGY